MINLPVINKSNNPLPEYQTKQSAGVDLCAFTSTDVILSPGESSPYRNGFVYCTTRGL